ncbi:MAG TPA: DUF962 domain-containing protein [Povalibacter sp.]|uniref:Mpo1 family 2-hydroxy fatty acid dioxygenase n=1 Tax=Povalibacter sp. TaxID=1962978 RepID=UPI002C643885|nr:Mpo1-like protein [Povalibacter sp.]HMN44290.1 DUF962 domain-containing protein [Povalibacter sp.]
MRTVNQWLGEYGESHRDPTNKLLHWICVPAIVVSLVGMLWSLPVPGAFREISPLLNWGTLLLAAGVLYYFAMSWSLALGMILFVGAVILAILGLQQLPWSLWVVCLILFAAAWVGQFIGHHYEGRKPSFFKDVQFLMIGPLWLLSFIYRQLGIRY